MQPQRPDTAPVRAVASRFARSAPAVAAALWCAAYALICLTGQRFSTAYLGYGWQLVPYEILRDDPFGSVWYLHIQPPLWNLVIGVLGRWSPLTDALSLQLLQAALGALTAAGAAGIARRLGLGARSAVAVALVATLNPEVVRNAFEPTYELAAACGLVGVVWALSSAGSGRTGRALVTASAVATAVVMTRSLYHPLWALATVGIGWLALRGRVGRRALVAAVAVPVVVAGSWMAKNEVLYGRATLSSWVGMNLQRAVIPVLDADDLQALFLEHRVSHVARIGPFGNYALYEPFVAPCTPEHHHPAASVQEREAAVVIPNFNYECFLPVYDQAGRDARTVIRTHPEAFLEGRAWAARVWFATNVQPDESRSFAFRWLSDVYRVARVDVPGTISTRSWGTPIYGDLAVPAKFSLTVVALTAWSAWLGVVHLWRLLRRRAAEPVRSLVLAVTGFTVWFTYAVGVVGELGEQARFRTMTDPLLVAVLLAEGVRRSVPATSRVVTAWRQRQAVGAAR